MVWKGPKEILLEFLSCLYSKNDHIKLTYYVIDESSISFLDLFLYKDANFSTLQFSTHQKPLNKCLCIPFESFHPTSSNRAFIRGELMCYTRNSSMFKVRLTPQIFFAKTCYYYLLFEIVLRKNFWIPLNPRFSVPRRNLENSSKTPPFCFTTEFEENGSSGSCDIYPGRFDISHPLISFRMVQYRFKKCAEMPSRGAIGCCSNVPDLKKDILYNLLTMIG